MTSIQGCQQCRRDVITEGGMMYPRCATCDGKYRDEALTVVAAAIREADGVIWSLPAPARHYDIHCHARERGVTLRSTDDGQGFVLSDGRFARRKPALRIADKAGQLTKGKSTAPKVGLFSEDVW